MGADRTVGAGGPTADRARGVDAGEKEQLDRPGRSLVHHIEAAFDLSSRGSGFWRLTAAGPVGTLQAQIQAEGKPLFVVG
jgi:hypothetical protein